MPKTVNRIRNPELRFTRGELRHWEFKGRTKSASHSPAPDGGVRIEAKSAPHPTSFRDEGGGSQPRLEQIVRCKPGEFYRVEAVIRFQLLGSAMDAGSCLTIEPLIGRRRGDRRSTPPVKTDNAWTVVRAYFQAPPGVKESVVSVGLAGGAGRADVQSVRFIHILEPEEESHALALAPPIHTIPPPKEVRNVCVCSAGAADRPLTIGLKLALGDSAVATNDLAKLKIGTLRTDALLLPDATPPSCIRTLNDLHDLAKNRIVVVSLPAFHRITGQRLRLRRIDQPDDPMHAKVAFSNFATGGFALADVFAFATAGKRDGGFAQNQFRKTPQLASFCKKHGYTTLLTSMCHTDAATGHPIAFVKQTKDGAVIVLDLEALESPSSTFAETIPAWHLLLTILGRTAPGLGQFTVPLRTKTAFRDMIREMGVRFSGFVVHDEDVPSDKVETQIVTVGGEDHSFGLPLRPRPVILIRSGLTSGDVESVYAALQWMKNLVRPEPHACPYAKTLAANFRIAWVPCSAGWEIRDGWRRTARPPVMPTELELDDAPVAGLIDIVSGASDDYRAVFSKNTELFRRAKTRMPRLFNAFGPGASMELHAESTEETAEGRCSNRDLIIEADRSDFDEPIHQQVVDAGGDVIRLELPADDRNFVNHSIAATGRAATLLELLIGAFHGLIAVNRTAREKTFEKLTPLAPGEAHLIPTNDPRLVS